MNPLSQYYLTNKLRREIRLLQNQYVLLLQELRELRKHSTSNSIIDVKEREKITIKLLVENKLHELKLLELDLNQQQSNVSSIELDRERGTKNKNIFLFFLFTFLAVTSVIIARTDISGFWFWLFQLFIVFAFKEFGSNNSIPNSLYFPVLTVSCIMAILIYCLMHRLNIVWAIISFPYPELGGIVMLAILPLLLLLPTEAFGVIPI